MVMKSSAIVGAHARRGVRELWGVVCWRSLSGRGEVGHGRRAWLQAVAEGYCMCMGGALTGRRMAPAGRCCVEENVGPKAFHSSFDDD